VKLLEKLKARAYFEGRKFIGSFLDCFPVISGFSRPIEIHIQIHFHFSFFSKCWQVGGGQWASFSYVSHADWNLELRYRLTT